MGIIVDLIIILIFALCIYTGYKRGLARCLFKIVTSILALIIAIVLYKPFVNFVIENTTIDDNIALSLERIIDQNSNENDNKIIDENSGIPKPIVNYLNDNVGEYAQNEKNEIITQVSKKAADIIVNLACIIIIYIIAKILLKILTILLDIVSKIPLIKQCNELGGIIYGIIEAILVIFIILTIISVVSTLIGDYGISNMILESHIGRFLYNNNLFLNLIF